MLSQCNVRLCETRYSTAKLCLVSADRSMKPSWDQRRLAPQLHIRTLAALHARENDPGRKTLPAISAANIVDRREGRACAREQPASPIMVAGPSGGDHDVRALAQGGKPAPWGGSFWVSAAQPTRESADCAGSDATFPESLQFGSSAATRNDVAWLIVHVEAPDHRPSPAPRRFADFIRSRRRVCLAGCATLAARR